MAHNLSGDDYWPWDDGIPDPQTEAAFIKKAAEKWRNKSLPEPNHFRPGFELRSQRSRTEVFQNLAVLQERYYATEERQEIKRIGTHALLLLIPMLGLGQKQLCQNTGLPCNKLRNINRYKSGWEVVRCQLRHGRHALAWQILTHFAAKQATSAKDLGYSMPLITIRWRKDGEEYGLKSYEKERQKRRRENAVGMAVLCEYKRYRPTAGNTIDAAFHAISKLDKIGDEQCGGYENVRKLYQEYRKAAFMRGYADQRAFWAECHGEQWPDDQLWLSDFPPIAGG